MTTFDSALAEWLYELTMVTGQDDDANDGEIGGQQAIGGEAVQRRQQHAL